MRPDELRHHLADSTFGEQRARDNAAWWRELSADQQRALIDSYPSEIGNAEGLPASARTEANAQEITRLHDELQSRHEAGEHLSRHERKELRRYTDVLAAVDNAKMEAARLGGEMHILAFDPLAFRGEGRIVVSVGDDPFSADSVSWHVPGLTTTMDSLKGNLDNALNHLASIRMQNPNLRAASIAWIGYDAPSGRGTLRVMFHGLARQGGAILHSDVLAFNAAPHAGASEHFSNNHIFGHSYGSTTTSYAGRNGQLATHVRSITLAGSPGAGPQHHAGDFGVGERVFVASSSRDFVTALGGRTPGSLGRLFGRGLGVDPAMESFGAHRVTAEFPRHMDRLGTVSTHTAYYHFVDRELGVRTESLANFGRIAADRFDEVHTEAHRSERAWWKPGWRTDEPAQGRPLQLDDANRETYSVERRIWDVRWHSDQGDAHVGDHDGRCAHDATEFLAQYYNRDVHLASDPGPSGVPARNLFEAWGSTARFAGYTEIHDTLLRHGDGAAAILASRWIGADQQGGHAYVAVNERGSVHLYERVGERFERSGWPPYWGEGAVDRTAVGYLDRHGHPLEPLDGRTGQLRAAEDVGIVTGGDHSEQSTPGLLAHPLPPDSPLFEGYQATAPGLEFTDSDGGLVYPDDTWPSKPYAIPGTVVPNAQLAPGTALDRFGWPGGAYLSPEGVLFSERALPPDSATKPYFRYVVDDPDALPPGYQIEQSRAAPWFHQPGGGTQYRIIAPDGQRPSVQVLIDCGFLKPGGTQ
ncbi:hypothetical protein A9W95_19315 [Mycobacterium sp. 1423905.2]|nr:hypothetical protein A9W95_19315 [Mycobacterium sp. 1423905.2]